MRGATLKYLIEPSFIAILTLNMAKSSEQDKPSFLTDEEWAKQEQIEEVNTVALEKLQPGDRLGIVAQWGESDRDHKEAFILEVSSIQQLAEGEKAKTKVLFRYFPVSLNSHFLVSKVKFYL